MEVSESPWSHLSEGKSPFKHWGGCREALGIPEARQGHLGRWVGSSLPRKCIYSDLLHLGGMGLLTMVVDAWAHPHPPSGAGGNLWQGRREAMSAGHTRAQGSDGNGWCSLASSWAQPCLPNFLWWLLESGPGAAAPVTCGWAGVSHLSLTLLEVRHWHYKGYCFTRDDSVL